MGNVLEEVYTATEAAELWGLNESTVRKYISYGKLVEGVDYRKAGRVTLITKKAMEHLYGQLKITYSNK